MMLVKNSKTAHNKKRERKKKRESEKNVLREDKQSSILFKKKR